MGSKEKKIIQDSSSKKPTWYKGTHLLLLIGICIATYISYSPGFSEEKEFTNWDDLGYVVEQPLIKTQNPDSSALLWKPETQVMLNYHPITMWTLAKNYESAQLDIQPYFKTNLFLHVVNAILVFILLFSLSNGSVFVSFFGSLLFAVHPMHVESVAWISERKDVLYTFFFLASLLAYQRYQMKTNYIWILICFILFVLSCLSKAMAVPLPIILFLMDYYKNRNITWKVILEKIPFLILAIWIGLNAIEIQSKGAITDFDFFTSWQRIMFASFGFLSYWYKFFIPTGLSAFYPYPNLDQLNNLPIIFYLAPFIVVFGSLILLWITFKRNVHIFKISLFGLGFFTLMVALVLQFISVGSAITADRYSYVPYIGIAFFILMIIEQWKKFEALKYYIYGSFIIFSIFLVIQSMGRTKVWTNSGTLWSDVIEKYPFVIKEVNGKVQVMQTGAEVAYKNRGNYYRENGDSTAAMNDYLVLVKARVKDPLIYSNVGNMYALMNNYDSSLLMYSQALKRNPAAFDVYLNRGITYVKMLDYKHATKDFEAALKLRKNDINALVNLSAAYLNGKKFNACIESSTKLKKLAPKRWEPYFYIGTAQVNMGNYTSGIKELEKALSYNPNDPYTWYNTGIAYQQLGEKAKAKTYLLRAKSLNYPVSDALLKSL